MSSSPSKSGSGTALFTGLFLLALAALVRPQVVGYNLTPDGHLAGSTKVLVVQACQVLAVLLGLYCLVKQRVPLVPASLTKLASLALLACVLLAVYGNLLAARIVDPDSEMRAEIAKMVESEEVLLQLSTELKKLARSAANLELPDHKSRHMFEAELSVTNLSNGPAVNHEAHELSFPYRSSHFEVAPAEHKVSRDKLELWNALLADVDYFERVKFYFHHGDFGTDERDIWVGDTRFAATVRLKSGEVASLHAKAKSSWLKTGEKDDKGQDVWRIGRWETVEAHAEALEQKMFQDVTAAALSSNDLRTAQRSIHEELVLEHLLQEEPVPPYEDFQLPSFDRHPAVTIVDIDEDGLDDIYIMARHGKNQLFQNTGSKSFIEVAGDYGLDIEGSCSAAIFADFDNDGDKDLFLGRTRERSRYYVNEDGRYVDRSSDLANTPLPYMTSSVAAADFNGDGLLDLYISTYGAEAFHVDKANMESLESGKLLAKFLAEEDAKQLWKLSQESDDHKFLKRPGPPNVLLLNAGGGRFELASSGSPAKLFRNTYHSSFGDYDNDGDQDLYCANDFSENKLFENDGQGNFTDVTERTGVADIGFGMGSDWGDYDNDGKFDLYVANMYSKAGQRITKQVSNLNPRFAKMARGNSLFKNNGDRFERVSDLQEPGLLVEAGGWSWGPQFVDFDNDCWLDIYTVSGFYSVPDAVALPLDL